MTSAHKITLSYSTKYNCEILVEHEQMDSLARKIIKHTSNAGSVFFVTDSNISLKHKKFIKELKSASHAEIYIIPGEEQSKSWNTAEALTDWLAENGAGRDSCVVAIGGGLVTDLCGFGASIYMRGIRLVLVPASLIAQTDSAIGGKNAINTSKNKNYIGTFFQPEKVFVNPYFLVTQPDDSFRTGFSEVIKYGMILDRKLFEFIELNTHALLSREMGALSYVIQKCCSLKAEIVSSDPNDRDRRMLLNFGHTFGHALEAASDYKYSHGEAVAWGMLCASSLAASTGICQKSDALRLGELLKSFGLYPKSMPDIEPDIISGFMYSDKKKKEGNLLFALPNSIGKGGIYPGADRDLIKRNILTAGNRGAGLIY